MGWANSLLEAENNYMSLLENGWSPENARGVLPLDLATTMVCTHNLREWRHIIKLRGSKKAHPNFRAIVKQILPQFNFYFPPIFKDIKGDN